MLQASGGVIVHSDVWCENSIVGDVWCDFGEVQGVSLEDEILRTLNYYLRQMNFVGNRVI